MRRVLVTGATGNVGRPTLEALAALGIPAVAARSPGSKPPPGGESVVLGRRPRAIRETVSDLAPLFARPPRPLDGGPATG